MPAALVLCLAAMSLSASSAGAGKDGGTVMVLRHSAGSLGLTTDAFAGAAIVDETGERATVHIRLAAEAAQALYGFTQDGLGSAATITVCGDEVARFDVLVPVESGLIVLPSRSAEDARKLVDLLDGTVPCTSGVEGP